MLQAPSQLDDLPRSGGFRLRGMEMTRLETFTDAAFAFAITMLVISVGTLPTNFTELVTALLAAPSFLFSGAVIMGAWVGHRRWSRRYGLEDTPSTLISLFFVFVMLVYVYPLRLMSSALFSWISGGRLPSEFRLQSISELTGLFVVYGIGFAVMAGLMAALFGHAARIADRLQLNDLEKQQTRLDITYWVTLSLTGLASALMAATTPTRIGVWSGFVYPTLCISMPWVATRFGPSTEPPKDSKEDR